MKPDIRAMAAGRGTGARRSRAWAAPAVLACVLVAASASGGCHRAPCGGAEGCPQGTICQLDGQCAPLGRGADIRFAEARHAAAIDWGVTRADAPHRVLPDDDTLALGGDPDATVYLAFGSLPSEVARAVLYLSPHQPGVGSPGDARLVVRRTEPFEGRGLTRSGAPSAAGSDSVLRGIQAGAAHPLRFDVTGLARAAARRGQVLHVSVSAVRAWDGPPWMLASPRSGDHARRPRLELLLR